VEDGLNFVKEEIDDDEESCMLLGSEVFLRVLSAILFHGEVSRLNEWGVGFFNYLLSVFLFVDGSPL